MTVAVITDSTAALPRELALELGVTVVPIIFTVDGVETPEGSMDTEALLSAPVSTAAPPPGAFAAAVAGAESPDGVVIVTVSTELSSTHQSAVLASRLGGDAVEVIDSGSSAGGQALVVAAAARAAATGADVTAVADTARRVAERVRLLGVLGGLAQLARTGRIPSLAGWAGDRLGMKPMFGIDHGRITRLMPARGVDAAHDRIMSAWRATRPEADTPLHVAAVHAEAPEAAQRLLDRVSAEHAPTTTMIGEFGQAMIAASGVGVSGLAWWWDD
jgi:DegV family protein with EDD domain